MTSQEHNAKGKTMRRFFGNLVSGREGRIGETRSYGSWTVTRTTTGWVARIGNAMSIEGEKLMQVLNRIDEAGKDI